MSLKHSACHTFRASGHLRWAPFRDSFSSVFGAARFIEDLQKGFKSMAGITYLSYGHVGRICFLYCPTTLKAWQALYFRDIYGVILCVFLCFLDVFLFYIFWESGELTQIPFFVQNMHLFCPFWEPFGSLRATFGRLLVTKVVQRVPNATQRLQDSPKRFRKDEMARLSQEV